MTVFKKKVSEEASLRKIRHFCAYQERSPYEVNEKLRAMGVAGKQAEQIIAGLIGADYLNEERFVLQFADSKFRLKHWGRVKIKYELKQKRVSALCIASALGSLDKEDYRKTLEKLAAQKWTNLAEENNEYVRKKKLRDYLLQKGYEHAVLQEILAAMGTKGWKVILQKASMTQRVRIT